MSSLLFSVFYFLYFFFISNSEFIGNVYWKSVKKMKKVWIEVVADIELQISDEFFDTRKILQICLCTFIFHIEICSDTRAIAHHLSIWWKKQFICNSTSSCLTLYCHFEVVFVVHKMVYLIFLSLLSATQNVTASKEKTHCDLYIVFWGEKIPVLFAILIKYEQIKCVYSASMK